jgi:hypothetical protein
MYKSYPTVIFVQKQNKRKRKRKRKERSLLLKKSNHVSYARQIVLSATVREANRIIFCFPHAIVLRGSYS